jgi:hypothetical protein
MVRLIPPFESQIWGHLTAVEYEQLEAARTSNADGCLDSFWPVQSSSGTTCLL